MTDSDRQDGLAARHPEGRPAEGAELRQIQIAETRLDDIIDDALPEVLPPNPYLADPIELPDLLEEPILETAGGPGASGGGGSSYNSDFGQLIAGLQSFGGLTVENAPTPAALAGFSGIGGASAPSAIQPTPGSTGVAAPLPDDSDGPGSEDDETIDGGEDTGPGGEDTGPGGEDTGPGGEDTGPGGEDTGPGGEDTGPGGEDTGPGGEDTGPGGTDPESEDTAEALFTVKADVVDFNSVSAGDYLDGTQYDADNQNDFVILPESETAAANAGFVPGTLFLAGNGDDSVFGGDLSDLVEGGNGDDLLSGGGGNDILSGGNGADTLSGGLGNDLLSGGNGKDVFAFSLASNEGDDVILDFTIGKNGDRLQLSDLLDANGDSVVDLDDLDAGGHSVSGTADTIVITFDSGATLTLDGINGTGVETFADLLDMTVNIDIV